MRLSKQTQAAIKHAFNQLFIGEIYLFGSRTGDLKKGGDIDLYIIPKQKQSAEQLYNKKIKFLVALQLAIGEQKIDIIFAKDKNRPIEKEAIRTGIKL